MCFLSMAKENNSGLISSYNYIARYSPLLKQHFFNESGKILCSILFEIHRHSNEYMRESLHQAIHNHK